MRIVRREIAAMKRKIVQIDKDLCNGCGLCVSACHEGAIQMLHGKATLISDVYCDGLGDCLPACPTNAIQIIEREAAEYSQEAVDALLAAKATAMPLGSHECSCSGTEGHNHDHGAGHGCHSEKDFPAFDGVKVSGGGCPGSRAMSISRSELETKKPVVSNATNLQTENQNCVSQQSELVNWPVQIKLVNPRAEYFSGANLLIAADCTAFAYANFHRDFVKDRIVLIGCPKLDDNAFYAEKLAEIMSANDIKSITVLRMEVPCCAGIVQSVKAAILKSQRIVPYNEVTIKLNGEIL